MGSLNIRDLLTSFSPSSDYLAIAPGDGRIKIWDTLKGQLQTDFADIISTDATALSAKSNSGRLSLDYTCMKWMPLEHKKKKAGPSLLVLGTGSGDVLALDIAAGQLRWRVNDCHPGEVNAISFSRHGSCIYTAGGDGMVCQIDSTTGSILGKFRSSTKALSSMAISPDGKMLATAAGQLKLFSCSDFKKIQKFTGHPVAVRSMIFTEDGKYILSSAVGEKYIAIWKTDGGKKQPACCVLSMDRPAVVLDSKGKECDVSADGGLFVLAISELGLCYFWHGRNIEELRNAKPTKISLTLEAPLPKNCKSSISTIFAAKIHGIVKLGSAQVSLAFGSVVKPSFEKLQVQQGEDVKLNKFQDGFLLPVDQSSKPKKGQSLRAEVTALDRANAEDAILPMPKLHDFHDKKRKHDIQHSDLEVIAKDDKKSEIKSMDYEDDMEIIEEHFSTVCMEDKLKSLGILANEDDLRINGYPQVYPGVNLDSKAFKDAHLLVEADMPAKKIKAAVLSMSPSDAYKHLLVLVATWKSRSGSGKSILPWINSILVNHSRYVISQESSTHILDMLYEMTSSKCAAIQPLLQLSGRLQLITAQIDKAGQSTVQVVSNDKGDQSEDEEVSEEFVYGEEEESLSGSDVDN